MDFTSLSLAREDLQDLQEFVETIDLVSGRLCINGLVALPLAAIAPSIDADQDIEIFDEAGALLGFLCLTTCYSHIEIASITDAQYVAYLVEVDRVDLYRSESYSFQSDYVVILKDRFDDYRSRYMPSSSIWGGFQEECDVQIEGYERKVSQIFARPNVVWPTRHHGVVAIASTMDHFSLERYLKLYHLLELGFDWDVVKQIQELKDDLKGIGKLLANHGREDIFLLKQIVGKCNDTGKLEQVMSVVFQEPYYTKAIEIFFAYEKESNPLKAHFDKFLKLKLTGSFSSANFRSVGLFKEDEYERKLHDIAAYWIYRTRCGIAHHRIGEYIITLDDEFFVVDFMEPLIREVITQIFTVIPPAANDYII